MSGIRHPYHFRLTYVTLLLSFFTLERTGVQATLKRCYDRLGCFDNAILNALPQEPDYIRTEFRLSCPQNDVNNVTIKAVDEEAQWKVFLDKGTCLQVERETAFIIHGFRDKAEAKWVTAIRNFLLTQKNFNVFALDWEHGAGFLYEQAAANTHLVSKQLSLFIQSLEQFKGLDPIRIHLIGHSLGAHIAGNAGSHLYPYKVSRITGLDPAEPYFDQVSDDQRLDANDALFVNVIHTDGQRFTGLKGFGSMRAQGHLDFYPNGGQKQPGCSQSASFLDGVGCSHGRARDLLVQSLTSTDCHLVGSICSSWQEFEEGRCMSCPPEGCVPMGLDTPSSAHGTVYLGTTSEAPFCGYTYHVEINTTSDQKHTFGHLGINIMDTNTSDNFAILGSDDQHFHASETHDYAVTVPHDVTQVEKVKVNFVKGSGSLSALMDVDFTLEFKQLKLTSFREQRSWVSCSQTVLLFSGQEAVLLHVTPGDSC